jgi:hypothetical protein
MSLHQSPERRKALNRPLALLVDTGVICRFSLGDNAAKLLYLTHNIPSSVANRVLYHASQRRSTELELAMSERGNPVKLAPLADWDGDH